MQIVPKYFEDPANWGSDLTQPMMLAALAQALNDWGAGIELAGTAMQMRYPDYVEPPVQPVEEMPVEV